ncbi:MAG: hypothetical protein KC493_04325 [Bacteriovoracaceae bacterium]|nr:hypothetical protein [Bacteriovoracaceae bacterium]
MASAYAAPQWEVSIVDAKQKIKRFKVQSTKRLKIDLEKTEWRCYLSNESEGKDSFARSIDCIYGKGPAYISSKLICPKKKFTRMQVNTFAIAEEKKTGYLLELICSPSVAESR